MASWLYMLVTLFCPVSTLFLGQESGGGAPSLTGYQAVISVIDNFFSEANLSAVLVYAVTGAMVLVFFWWAARKVASIIKKAFMRGKLKF